MSGDNTNTAKEAKEALSKSTDPLRRRTPLGELERCGRCKSDPRRFVVLCQDCAAGDLVLRMSMPKQAQAMACLVLQRLRREGLTEQEIVARFRSALEVV